MPNDDAEPPRDASTGSGPAHDRRRRFAIVGAIVGGIVALDQLTKAWAVSALADGPVSIIGNDVELRLGRNTGGAFSLFQGMTPLLAILAVVLAVVLVRAVRNTDELLGVIALALVLAGALGNLSDRILRAPGFFRGAVVDFVRVGSFPTFNVADSAITIGAILLIIWVLFGGGSHGAEAS